MEYQDLINLGMLTPHSGVLLFGPSGTGKTMLARAIGKESVGCTFMKIKGTDLLNKYIGGSEKRLNTLFEIAEEMAPCIIFLDEIEGIMGTKEADSKLVHMSNMLLDLTSDMAKKQIFLIGCTNYPQRIDPTFLRRFSKKIYVPLPNETERDHLVRLLLKKEQHTFEEEDIQWMAKATENYTPAEINAIIHKAQDIAWNNCLKFNYFKPTVFKSGFFTPCMASELNAIEVTYKSLKNKTLLPLPFFVKDIKDALKFQKSSTQKEHLKELEDWMLKFQS